MQEKRKGEGREGRKKCARVDDTENESSAVDIDIAARTVRAPRERAEPSR